MKRFLIIFSVLMGGQLFAGPIGKAFQPQQTGGLVRWWTAASLSGTANAASVSAWTDLTPAKDTVRSAPVRNPVFLAASQAGKPCLFFNGSMILTNLTENLFKSAASGAMLVVCRTTNTTVPQGLAVVTTIAPVSIANLGFNSSPFMGYTAGGRRLGTDSFQNAGDSNPTTALTLFYAKFNWASARLETVTNGVAQASTTAFQTAGLTDNTAADLCIGVSSPGGAMNFLRGEIYEVAIWQPAPSDSELARVAVYFRQKYGLRVGANP